MACSRTKTSVPPRSPSPPPSIRVLSACIRSPLMYHKFADTVTSARARAGNQRAHPRHGKPSDSPRLPTMPFAYGRCHQGAGLCQLRVTCPLQLLYVIIEPICSAQRGLDGNHEAAIGEMEGKCEEGMERRIERGRGEKKQTGGMMVRVRATRRAFITQSEWRTGGI